MTQVKDDLSSLPLQIFGQLDSYLDTNGSDSLQIADLLRNEIRILEKNNKLRCPELIALIAVNTTLMLFGAAGALVLIAAVVRKPRMRTPRTMLTVNLSVSDLTLCLFTQPFNLIRTLHWHYEWRFGEIMCKFTSFAQAANVFVATMSIIVIALDRFNVIIHPFRSKRFWSRPICVLPGLWLLAFIMASPMLAFSTVSTGISFTETLKPRLMCVEADIGNQNLHTFKFAYGIFTLIFQYLVPFFILVAVYIRICSRIHTLSLVRAKNSQQATGSSNDPQVNAPLETQLNVSHSPKSCLETAGMAKPPVCANAISTRYSPSRVDNLDVSDEKTSQKPKPHQNQMTERRKLRQKRQRRTNILLTCVSLMFAISWLPLHAVNIYMDYKEEFGIKLTNHSRTDAFLGARHVTLIQSACLLCVLFSCCINPLLYGYLNENYRKEFAEILTCCHCFRRIRVARRRQIMST